MAGDGPLAAVLATEAANAGVEMMGARSDVPELLRSSDVFVFTSRSEGEGLPGVLIEAALSGLPIVTTDVPGARDVVDDGVTGYVVPEPPSHDLAKRVAQLVDDRSLRQRMGAAGRARAEERFTLQATSGMWRELLTSLVESG